MKESKISLPCHVHLGFRVSESYQALLGFPEPGVVL
jgi:hypothetical protein